MLLISFICSYILLFSTSFGENIIESDQLKKYAFENAPKKWFVYIKKLLYVISTDETEKYTEGNEKYLIIHLIKTISYKVVIFLKGTRKESHQKVHIKLSSHDICKSNFTKTHVQQKKPYESIKRVVHNFNIMKCAFNDWICSIDHTWFFNLDPNLRLDLAFHSIFIGYMDLHNCFIGNVSVVSYNTDYTYCGVLSNMITYPPHKSIQVKISSRYGARCDINMSYSVMDSNRIISLKPYIFQTSNELEWTLNFIQNNISVQRFYILINKLQVIHISIATYIYSDVYVYDGPGTLSPKIVPVTKGQLHNIHIPMCGVFVDKCFCNIIYQ